MRIGNGKGEAIKHRSLSVSEVFPLILKQFICLRLERSSLLPSTGFDGSRFEPFVIWATFFEQGIKAGWKRFGFHRWLETGGAVNGVIPVRSPHPVFWTRTSRPSQHGLLEWDYYSCAQNN